MKVIECKLVKLECILHDDFPTGSQIPILPFEQAASYKIKRFMR